MVFLTMVKYAVLSALFVSISSCQTDKEPPGCATQSVGTKITKSPAELLVNDECSACHAISARVIGNSFMSISEKNYTDSQLVKLTRLPKLINDSAEFEHSFKHLHDSDLLEIASWIKTLKKPLY